MTGLGIWLSVVGCCDLLRAARDLTSRTRRTAIAVLGVLVLLFAAVALEVRGRGWLVVLAAAAAFLLWLLASAAALGGPDRPPGRGVAARTLAFTGLGTGVVLGLLVADPGEASLPRLPELPGALSALAPDRAVLALGVALVQLATANVVVRQILDAVGVPAATNEKRLKGGRLLGPMERLFIVGLGLAGQLTAAAVVVAAKGLLRFPELQRGATHGGASDVSEYFLIGSLASWLVALAGLGLLAVPG